VLPKLIVLYSVKKLAMSYAPPLTFLVATCPEGVATATVVGLFNNKAFAAE
jgi:hypothetical protein